MLSGNSQAVHICIVVLQIWTRLTITRQHMTAKPKLSSFILSVQMLKSGLIHIPN